MIPFTSSKDMKSNDEESTEESRSYESIHPPTNESSSILLRPASLYKYLMSRGPLLIGWDDDKFRHLVEKSKELSNNIDTQDTYGTDRRTIEELKSNLSNIFVDALVTNLTQLLIQKDEGLYGDTNIATDMMAKKNSDVDTRDHLEETLHDKVPLYHLLSHTVKYHRDSYLTGTTYAAIQRFQRTQKRSSVDPPHDPVDSLMMTSTWGHHYMPVFHSWKKEESLASVHLQGLVTWFIPSRKMIDLVRPTLLWTISPPLVIPTNPSSIRSTKAGPLYTPLVQVITSLIPLSQNLVDPIVKDTVIGLLQNPEWRLWVKGTTGGYVSRLQRDVRSDR